MQKQNNLSTRILSLVLTAVMALTTFPATAFAAEGTVPPQTPSTTPTITRTITAFDELGEGFEKSAPFDGQTYVRNVEINTAFKEVKLPTELSVTVEKVTTTPSAKTTAPTEKPKQDSAESPKDTTPPKDTTTADKSAPSDAGEKPNAEAPPAVKPDESKQDKDTVVTETIQEKIPVTWNGDKEYTPDQSGKVIYTAELPEGYALADSAKLPIINVIVGKQAPTPRNAKAAEQFSLPTGGTYYFDLSSEKSNVGTINSAVPDATLHYVPFTYAGTVNAYSLDSNSSGNTGASAAATATDRSLFVADYNISHTKPWIDLNTAGLIFGKPFDTNYKLRSLSMGSDAIGGTGDAIRGTPTTNEWDSILNKSSGGIKNWQNICSWGQDTSKNNAGQRFLRGNSYAREFGNEYATEAKAYAAFRPALEVQNVATLGVDGLKAVTLNLNGGKLKNDTSINIICAGDKYKAPSGEGLTRPTDKAGTYFAWNTQANGSGDSYAVGATDVPNTVTTLYAQWEKPVEEQFSLPTGGTYYFDLSLEKNNIGTVRAELPDTTLHYVPFTYEGTVNSYSLGSGSSGDMNASAKAISSDRSLFVADYNIGNAVSWNGLNGNYLIFGKNFDTNYTLRSLSVGSNSTGSGDTLRGTPTNNEWDSILNKSPDGIKNWRGIFSWGQDTWAIASGNRALRGYDTIRKVANDGVATNNSNVAFRPALEVLNPTGLGKDGLKAVTLNLNGGKLKNDTSISIICAGDKYKAPSGEGLTRPTDKAGTYFKWNTKADGSGDSYEAGATDVPNTVTTLYAQWEKPVEEQFSLPTGGTYYFDLSLEKNNIGTVNTAVPDTTLHYVPFTYAGTVNSYSLVDGDGGNTGASAAATASDRSLFVADYNISHTQTWNSLNGKSLIFGKNFDTNYTLRSLSAGSWVTGSGDTLRGTPTTNEWDSILNKSPDGIKNWNGIYSIGQDTMANNGSTRAVRGGDHVRFHGSAVWNNGDPTHAFRPALEVLNPATLGKDGLKAVTLDLNGGNFNGASSIKIVCAGDTFKAPSGEGLTRPSVSNSFGWNTQADGKGTSYAVGADVPKSVTTLYAHWSIPEQFSLPLNETYYFDLSNEKNKIGTVNTAVPDTTLHYVPFTYAGTMNAYSLDSGSSGDMNASARAIPSDHSLFVSDYNISHTVSWNKLHTASLIFGKTFDTNYKLRSLSMGSDTTGGSGDAERGTPTINEWDGILNKSPDGIKNWQNIYSWGQDTIVNYTGDRPLRGHVAARRHDYNSVSSGQENFGFRPVLEVQNVATLGKDGLKAVTLNLNGGKLKSDTSISIICAGATFKAPSGEGLTRPTDKAGTYFKWNTKADGSGDSYEAGATDVPNTVTTLYAQWAKPEQFSLPLNETYYFDLSEEAGKIGTINTAVPDATLHYVPFTYAGTVNAYSLETKDDGIATTQARANALLSDRSLFVSDYNISHTKSWIDLNKAGLIFGKSFDANYKLRSLSMGSDTNGGSDDADRGTPTINEWDGILNKSSAGIKNWQNLYSWGQDTIVNNTGDRPLRGHTWARRHDYSTASSSQSNFGFRPVLEVLNPTTLGKDGLKAVTLDLNGGSFDSNGSVAGGVVNTLKIVCAGATFKAPSGECLTRPSGSNSFGWNTQADGKGTSYAVGADVPKSVTTLYAHWSIPEQFSLPLNDTYYFDLSSEYSYLGTINTAVPDTTLHYVPFTYAGTMNAYSLEKTDDGIPTTQARADARLSDRSLFVADYNISHTKSWIDLNTANLIFGKPFDANYTLRSLSMGSLFTGSGDTERGTPNTNEWDGILNKSSASIKNWQNIYSWGQDTREMALTSRVDHGGSVSVRKYDSTVATASQANVAFRPALEVLNPTTLGNDGLKAVTLDLNGGNLKGASSIKIVCAGDTFKAPSGTGLTRPNSGGDFRWNTAKDGSGDSYDVGDKVPNTVTTLFAQWAPEQFKLPRWQTYYFDLSSQATYVGTINTAVPDQTLHYVPFTYAGTVKSYSLDQSSSNDVSASGVASFNSTNRSLFVGDYTISRSISWHSLNSAGLIFGKPFDANYKLRSLSVGSNSYNTGDATRGTPQNNEWDSIVAKNGLTNSIKNWQNFYSWGQDTTENDPTLRAARGFTFVVQWATGGAGSDSNGVGYRPALEVLNPATLTPDGLKAVTLDLNGGNFDSNGSVADGVVDSLKIVCSGANFKAPSKEGLTRPTGNTGTYLGWNTAKDGKGTTYAIGAEVPNTVTTLYAQWTPKQEIVVDSANRMIYAGCIPLLIVGTDTVGNSTIYIDKDKNGVVDAGEQSLLAAGIIDAPSDNSDLSAYTIYGGGNSVDMTGDSLITLTGGKLKAVYGAGKSKSATVSGTKTVQVQGKPIVTTGIDLASLTNEKVLVCGALKGNTGAIRLIPPANATAGKIVAEATNDANKPFVNAAKFSLATGELVLDKAAKTVVLSGALDTDYSGSNITVNLEHFGTDKASYGKEWIGVLLPAAGYKLPDDVTLTIGGNAAVKGTDYSYNKITGEIKIEAVNGNISIKADGAPIEYAINYNANGGLVNGKPIETVNVKYGDTVTFPTATRNAGANMSFLGWAYKPDAVTADFNGGATANKALSNIDTAQITLYAVWQSGDNLPTSLQNGSFELPAINAFSQAFDYTRTNNIKWMTTASDKKIELGNPSRGLDAAYSAYGTRTASVGLQFAELNASSVAALYQKVATEPESTLYWGLDHRARSKTNPETMEVWIGSEPEVTEAINAYKADGNRVSTKTMAVFAKYPSLKRTANITHDWLAWYPVDGTYTVPTGQTTTMFAFVSISNPAYNSCGNLLDNVFFSTVKPRERKDITIRAGIGGTVRVSDASGFTVVNKTTTYNKSLELGEMLQATVMANSGYSFNGGYVDGKYYTKEDLLTGFNNLRLTMAKETPKEITILFAKDSTISFNPNGGSYSDDEKTLVADVSDASNFYALGTPARDGYTFTGWLVAGTDKTLTASDVVRYITSGTDGTTTLACGAKVSVKTEQGMMLIAQWKETSVALVTTTLILNPNGGRYGEEKSYGGETIFEEWQTSYELDASYGGENALVLKAPVRAGYDFIGWKDAGGKYTTDLADGDKIEYTLVGNTAKLTVGNNAIADAPETLTLTAQWTKLPDPPVITTQPSGKSLTYGYTADNATSKALSVAATVATGDTLGYQWYSNTKNSNNGGTIISGANSSSYTVPEKLSVGSHYYYCEVAATKSNKSTKTTTNAATVTVEKATLAASYAGERITFGDTATPVIDVKGFVNGETALTAAGYTAPIISTAIPTKVGNYKLAPSGGTADNYNFTYTAGTLTISAGSMTSGVASRGYTGVYDGAAHGIAVTLSGKATGATITYGNTAADCTKAALTYTDAGNYRVYYKVSKEGYAAVTGSAMVNISKKPVSIKTATANNKIYDGDTKTTGAAITLSGIVGSEAVTASGNISFANKNVGINKAVDIAGITLSGADAKNYTIAADASNVSTTAEITKKPVTLSWQNSDKKTYDGQPANVTATVASGLVGGDICNVTITGGKEKNAGTHTATAALVNQNYSIDSNNTKDYIISKAKLTATYEGESIIYKDKAPTLKVKVTGFVNGETALTVATYTAPTVTFPTVDANHVGEHTLAPSGGSATNYEFNYVSGVLKILARDFNMVGIKDYLGDYDGAEHTIAIDNKDQSVSNLAIKYYTDNTYTTETTSKNYTHRTDAGETIVYYKVSANGYNETQGKSTITINKKKVTPSVDAVSGKSYDGNADATGTIKLNGMVAGDDVTATGSMQFTDKNAGTNKSVTVNGITLGGTKAGNYELTAAVLNAATTAEIAQKEITLTWSGHAALKYTGKAQNVTATIPDGKVVTGDTVNLTVTGGKKTAVGTNNTATATIDNSNYSLANATQSYDIGKATLIAKYADESIVHGNLPALAVTVTGFVNGETALTAAAYTAPTISTTPIPTDAGTHTIALAGGTADNYSFTLQSGTLTITAADMSSDVTSSGYDAAYDGAAHGITVNIPVGATVKYYSDAAFTTELSGGLEKITNVADSPKAVYYKVTKPNYKDVNGNETITITRKTLTPAISTVNSKNYDGNTSTTGGALTLSGIVGNDAVTASGTITFADKNAGKNKAASASSITLGGINKDNYTLSATELTNAASGAEIWQKEVTLSWDGDKNLVYDNIAKNVTATAGALLTGDKCTVTVSGGKETLPGTYTATATALSDQNYKLPIAATKSYTIALATFAITATPYDGPFDNMAHRGVTLSGTLDTDIIAYSIDNGNTWTNKVVEVGAVGDTTITIKVERQHHATVTQKVTAKVWQAPIIKLLKPDFDKNDIKKATLGGTVTEGDFAIDTQVFEYRKVGSKNWIALNAGTTSNKITTYGQTIADLEAKSEYELRLSATDIKNNKASETLFFMTQPTTPPTGAIEGEIGGGAGGTGNITVTLQMGNVIVKTITGVKYSDKFTFEKLVDGEYNLVATDGTYTVTKMATVKDGKTTTLALILIGNKQSVVKVKEDAPRVAVDGLNEIFNTNIYQSDTDATGAVNGGGTVEMRLTADNAKKQKEIDAIRQKATDKKTIGMLVDLSVDMYITPHNGLTSVKNITDTEELMTIAMPLKQEAKGQQNYRVLRFHNGNVDELTQLSTHINPTTEGFCMEENYAYFCTKKFSTYAIIYDKVSGGGSSSDGGNGSGGNGNGGGSGSGAGSSGGSGISYYYTITPKTNAGGRISPNKPVTVRGGNSAAFTMTPDKGYEIKDVKVDGKSVGSNGEYLFTNVWEDHTIAVTFKKAAPVSPSKPKPDTTTKPKPETTPETAGKIDSDNKQNNKQDGKPDGKPDGEQDDKLDNKQDSKLDNKPDTASDDLNKQKEDIKDDLTSKRDDAIAALPSTLTDEQRQDAIDELNKICDDAQKALNSAKSAAEVSDILNNAIQSFGDTMEEFGGELPMTKPANVNGKRPFILLSALLALIAIILAALTILKKCTKKHKLIAILGALLAVIIFIITTGWSGIAFANLWTIAVALATALPAIIVIMKIKDKQEKAQEENPQ